MNGKSKKVIETEKFVDGYILKHGYPPTYDVIQEKFKIGRAPAYARCKSFRYKMNTLKKRVIEYDLLPEAVGATFTQFDKDGNVIGIINSFNLQLKTL